jgi:hypothetical protein
MEAFATAIVHGGFFLNFAVSVNWIGPEFQRKVRGAPFHPSFSWSAASLTAATPTIPAMPIAAAPIILLIFSSQGCFYDTLVKVPASGDDS